MSRYSKNLSGVGEKVIVTGSIAYTADATIAAFLDGASEGEIGVFLKDGTLKTTALVAGEEFVIAQMRDGFLNKTPILKFDDIFDSRLVRYDAPVKQVSTIGYPGSGTNDIGIVLTSASSSNALTFGVSARETTPGNQPFPVQEGYATAISTTADEYSIVAEICSQLNGDLDYERTQPDKFVKAEILSNGALTGLGQTLAVVNGSRSATAGAAVSITAGTLLSIAGTIYKVPVAVSSSTSVTLDRPYQGATATVASGTSSTTVATMAYTSGTTLLGIRLTALEYECHFKVIGMGELINAPVAVATAWNFGSGYGPTVVELEKNEGIIWDGVGATRNVAFREDYGQPTLFASASVNYDFIFLDLAPSILPGAGLPNYQQKQIQRVLIAAPTSGTTPISSLETVFGL